MLSALYTGSKIGLAVGAAGLSCGLVMVAGAVALEASGTWDWLEERDNTRDQRNAEKRKKRLAKEKEKAKAKKVKAKAARKEKKAA